MLGVLVRNGYRAFSAACVFFLSSWEALPGGGQAQAARPGPESWRLIHKAVTPALKKIPPKVRAEPVKEKKKPPAPGPARRTAVLKAVKKGAASDAAPPPSSAENKIAAPAPKPPAKAQPPAEPTDSDQLARWEAKVEWPGEPAAPIEAPPMAPQGAAEPARGDAGGFEAPLTVPEKAPAATPAGAPSRAGAEPAPGEPDLVRPRAEQMRPTDRESGFYMGGAVGGHLRMPSANSVDGAQLTAATDPGLTLSASLGHVWANGLRAEGEVLYARANLDDIRVTDPGRIAGLGTGNFAAQGKQVLFAMMVNTAYGFSTGNTFVPFVLGGVGAARRSLDGVRAGGIAIRNVHEWALAYQAGAGVRAAVSDGLSADVRYRYLGIKGGGAFDGGGSHTVALGATATF